jgi:epsilon-lactone hydrolase
VDDAERAFLWLMEIGVKPQNIAIAGDSAGGGLVVALLLRLKAKQKPMPACAVWPFSVGGFDGRGELQQR